jgi:predicted RNase H-like HicB family nuclease
MVNDDETIPGFHAVDFMRQAREQLSRDIKGKSFEEIRRMLDETMEKWEQLRKERERTPTSSR